MKEIPLTRPYITQEVKDKVCEVLDSGYLTEDSVTKEFEDAFKAYIGCDYALAVCNCTVGLEIGLRSLGVGPGDEVIVPDYTYPATADVVEIIGAKIVIVDVDPKTMLINYDALEQAITPYTKAIMPVSLFGNPLNYERLNIIKQKYNLYILEDAACSIGAKYRRSKVGNLADISVFSFHPRKFITTGEGGMITTNNSDWAEWMLSYKHFGMGVQGSRSTTSFDRIGSNYKMSDILGAVGLVQMRHIDELLEKRLELSQNYIDLLSERKGIKIPETTEKGKHSRQSFCIYVENRDEVMNQMRGRGIEVQIGTFALHMQPAFASSDYCRIHGEMSGSRYAFDHCLTLPLYHELTAEDQTYVVQCLHNLVN
jgi:dTDP-4-amino-4,6-dideoxygalactose transaminase